jgi:hypothetical protein
MAQVESLRSALRTQPFRPFELKLVDGSVYKVPHPDYLIIPPVRRPREAIFFSTATGGAEEYDAHWLDLGLICEVVIPGSTMVPPIPRSEPENE